MLLGVLGAGCASAPPPKPKELLLLDEAERALGSPEAVARLRGFHSTTRGTLYRDGAATPYTGEWWFRLPLAFRWRVTAGGASDEGAVDGEAGFALSGGDAADLDPGLVRDAQQHAVENAILLVRPLRSKDFTITYAGPGETPRGPSETLRVSWRGIVTRVVHFDAATHLVVKTEGRTALTEEGEGNFELFVDRWADEGGIQFPRHTVGLWNGDKRFEDECLAIEWQEPPAETFFRKPAPPASK